MAASKKAKQDRANAKEDRKEMTESDARFGAISSQFEAEQADYYNQLNRQRKQRGLDQFRQFSTMNQFAPEMAGGNNVIALPNKPDINALIKANVPAEEQTPQVAGKKKGLLESLSGVAPWDKAIGRATDKLFS